MSSFAEFNYFVQKRRVSLGWSDNQNYSSNLAEKIGLYEVPLVHNQLHL